MTLHYVLKKKNNPYYVTGMWRGWFTIVRQSVFPTGGEGVYTLFWFPNINSFKTHVNIKFHTVQTAAYTIKITAITDIKNRYSNMKNAYAPVDGGRPALKTYHTLSSLFNLLQTNFSAGLCSDCYKQASAGSPSKKKWIRLKHSCVFYGKTSLHLFFIIKTKLMCKFSNQDL